MPFERSESIPLQEDHHFEDFPVDDSQEKTSKREKMVSNTTLDTMASTPDTSVILSHENRGNQSWGKGIVEDYQRTLKLHWKEEMTNPNGKVLAVSFFLFFACIAPAITFGAIYAKATENRIGAVEMIAATSWCGILYALIGGQPMMINGGTGPVLAFTEIIFSMSKSIGVPFLTFNAWIGLWVCFYMLLAAFFDLNRIIKHATRFTDEIFALLISTIFIINALGNPFAPVGVYYYFEPDHKSHDDHQDDEDYSYMATAFWSLIICLGTVYVAFALRKMKFGPFLPNQVCRNFITDFAVVLSIAFWTLLDQTLFDDVETETLNVPDTFAPTMQCCTEACDTSWPDDCPELEEPWGRRSWLVDLGNLNGKAWVAIVAAGPAFLAFILVFLDDGITWHLINHPSHKLTHGDAFNYDTVIIGLMIAINSILGFPWLVAATVRSLNHLHALAEKSPEGKILSVHETRLSHLLIHILCLVSIFALGLLQVIPMPVLYGVFLFMGLVSLGTNQFWGRILMFFMQPKHYPVEPYTVHVMPKRMHYFTLLQLALFILLYMVKAIKTIAIAFPLIIACCIPIRIYLLPKWFTEQELVMLDSDDDTIKKFLDAQYVTDKPGSFVTSEMKKESMPDEEMHQETPHEDEDHEEEDHEEEHMDLHMPLPDTSRQARHARRKKTVSCPPHMLFAEVPLSATSVDIQAPMSTTEPMSQAALETESSTSEVSSVDGTTLPSGAEERPRHRRKKKHIKSVSCPPHFLFKEAERHVAKNYFFG